MQLNVQIYFGLQFFKYDNLKYKAISRRRSFYWRHHISAFCPGNLGFTYFCQIGHLSFFLLCFRTFCKFSCLFYKYTFVLTFITEMFYFILAWKMLKTIKKICVFLPTSNKSTMKNNPHMLFFSKSGKLSGRERGKFFCYFYFYHYFVCIHIFTI